MGRRKQSQNQRPPSNAVIPEDEQWRLISESGVLNGYRRPESQIKEVRDSDDEEDDALSADPLAEEAYVEDTADLLFNSVLLITPMCFLYLMMDILCRMQYAQHPTIMEEIKRMLSVTPFISTAVFYSNKHKRRPITQFLMFFASILAGIRLVYIVNNSGFRQVIRQSPPLATIWVYVIIQLNLAPAVISLGVIAGLVKYMKLKIIN